MIAEASKVRVLHPGDVALGLRGDRLETLLGSCVAIVLTDARRTLGAMCHIVHSNPCRAEAPCGTAYAEPALRAMFSLLQAKGIDARRCEAYVFGGGNMFPALVRQRHVGTSNAEWALDTLAGLRIRVVAQDLGGTTYRRLSWTVGPAEPRVLAVEV